MKSKLYILVVFAALSVGGMVFGNSNVYAAVDCTATQYSSTIKLAPGAYEAYIRNEDLAPGQDLTLAVQNEEATTCVPMPAAVVKGQEFTRVATLQQSSSQVIRLVFLLDQDQNQNQTVKTAVSLFLLPVLQKPCELLAGPCIVNYAGTEMQLTPAKLSYEADTLRTGVFLPIVDTTVKRIVYAVDGKRVYEKQTLEPFNKNYVGGGEHTVTRRIIFTNGQTLHDTASIERGTAADLHYSFLAFLYRSSELAKIIGVLAIVLLLAALVRLLVKVSAKKRLYQQTHTAGHLYALDSTKIGAQKNFYDESVMRVLYRYRRIWGTFLAISAVILGSSYFLVSIFTVDGVSMQPTLQNDSKKILLRAPQTLASILRSDYVPKRGTIVVINKSEENLFIEDQPVESTSYVVKRVIGLPGDRVVVKDGVIAVYNTENEKGFVPDDTFKWVSDISGSEFFTIDTTLQDGEVFVVGDNRDESIDSRYYGAVQVGAIVGSVL